MDAKTLWTILDGCRIQDKYLPKDGVTHCNEYVQEVCKKCGYDGFKGLNANQIYDKCLKDWVKLGMNDAAYEAQAGELIIAAWKNPKGGHGHCAPVYPLPMQKSTTWKDINGGMVPIISNVGVSNGVMRLSGAFSVEHKPDFFAQNHG